MAIVEGTKAGKVPKVYLIHRFLPKNRGSAKGGIESAPTDFFLNTLFRGRDSRS